MDTLKKRFHVNFLGYAHWFMSIIISEMKYHSIYVGQDIYATSIVAKKLDTSTVKESTTFYNTTFPRSAYLEFHKYTNRHSHQHKIRQQFLIHLVHTYNIYTSDIEIE